MVLPIQRIRELLAPTYTIDRELGRGGMATVCLAQDTKHERVVALKVLHPGLAESVGPERFLREIKVVARLNHPHILPLFDSGEVEGFIFRLGRRWIEWRWEWRRRRKRVLKFAAAYCARNVSTFTSIAFSAASTCGDTLG